MAIIRMVSFSALLAFLSVASAKNMGAINIEGIEQTVYVVAPDWSEEFVTVQDNGLTLSRGGRIYFAKDPADNFSDPDMYWQAPLLGHHFSYEIGNDCNVY